jgi:8-oxo-dGTP diphosphatase
MRKQRMQVAVGVVRNAAGQILIALRAPTLHQGGLWEFPGGKLEVGETADQALRRELKEELDITVQSATPLISICHQYPEREVQLLVFEVSGFSGLARGNEGQPVRWVEPEDLAAYTFPAANRPIIAAVQLPPYYAILEAENGAGLRVHWQKIIASGATLVQIRAKGLPRAVVAAFLDELNVSGQGRGITVLVSSSLGLAEHPLVQGIHLTSQDLRALKQRPKNVRWLAASCHNADELRYAQAIGADFAVLAPVLPTLTHPDAETLGWGAFSEWVAGVNLPVYALGGMALTSLTMARQAGAQGIASIRAFLV